MYIVRKHSNDSSKVEFHVSLAEETLARIKSLAGAPDDSTIV